MSPDQQGYISHYDLYIMSMLEVGADITPISNFIESIRETGSFDNSTIEDIHRVAPAIKFVKHTLKSLKKGKHCVAASFCYGREDVIPGMFTRILNQLNISDIESPKFHYYLERHIEVDGDHHGEASKRIVEMLCDNDPKKVHEAEQAACDAIQARIDFFNELERLIVSQE